ncbi:hypothetical protein KY084_10440 [Stakelama sp. CBK3Z-3]|uniref:Uncharacterized protein n=1 Tax=Stakelama flava TaxID=2860338 RepID=A0ABS6XM45_9SPHN|nr:hypothetical protein [Stakelama flava]MBW4331289.1 hypothetical protein [Stakelama flava]
MTDTGRAARRNRYLKHAGLAATILLAPGGFLLGSALAWRYYRARRAQSGAGERDGPV